LIQSKDYEVTPYHEGVIKLNNPWNIMATYRPGTLVTLVTPGTIILADLDNPQESTDQLWSIMMGETPRDLLEIIMGSSLRNSKSFGLLRFDAEGIVILLRGKITCQLCTPTSTSTIDAGPTTTWLEHRVETDVTSITLADEDVSNDIATFPMLGGIGLAGSVTISLSSHQPTAISTPVDPAPVTPASVVTEQPVAPPPPVDPAFVDVAPAPSVSTPTIDHGTRAESASATNVESAQPPPLEVEPAVATEPAATDDTFASADTGATPAPATSDGHDDTGLEDPTIGAYADLIFGHTRRYTIEEAAVRPADDEPESLEGPPIPPVDAGDTDQNVNTLTDPVDDVTPPAPAHQETPSRPPGGQGPTIIDHIPWLTRSTPESESVGDNNPVVPAIKPNADAPASSQEQRTSGVSSDTPTTTEASEFTISRAQRQRIQAQQVPTNEAAVPHVQAIYCQRNHPNPTTAVKCRICGVALQAVEPVTIPRPPLGKLVMSTGEEFLLDRPVLIGRDPSNDRLISNEKPHLIRVSSPDREISRNHAEIQLDGWRPILIDLKSMNGTKVTVPGHPPERLRPGNRYPLQPGSVIELDDDVSLTFVVDDHG
jgi:hypothetical protein